MAVVADGAEQGAPGQVVRHLSMGITSSLGVVSAAKLIAFGRKVAGDQRNKQTRNRRVWPTEEMNYDVCVGLIGCHLLLRALMIAIYWLPCFS